MGNSNYILPKKPFVSITEDFGNTNTVYPKSPDAYNTGEFNTLNRKSKNGLKKCTKCVNGCNGMTYWCATDCENKELNIHGREIKEPMEWYVRFS